MLCFVVTMKDWGVLYVGALLWLGMRENCGWFVEMARDW